MRDLVSARSVRIALVSVAIFAAILLLPNVMRSSSLLIAGRIVIFAVAVVGFNLMYYSGQLSLAHPFYMGVGGFGYIVLAGAQGTPHIGLGLPPLLALTVAVLIAGVLGLLFSPITARIEGLSLAAASLALTFIGAYAFPRVASLTGGSAGRRVEPFSLGSWFVADTSSSRWIAIAIIGALSFVYASKLIRSRVGLGLHAIRDGDLFARAVGVNVGRYKAQAFFVSSMFAGLSGALLGMVFGVLVPEPFGFVMAIDILLIAILGGATYVVSGALAGSAIFVLLPELLDRHASLLPFISSELGTTGGIGPTELSRYIFGAAVVALIIGEPDGVVALLRRLRGRWSQSSLRPKDAQRDPPGGAEEEVTDDVARWDEGPQGAARAGVPSSREASPGSEQDTSLDTTE